MRSKCRCSAAFWDSTGGHPAARTWTFSSDTPAEYWWNVGRLSDPDFYNGQSAGEVGAYGAVLRLEYNY